MKMKLVKEIYFDRIKELSIYGSIKSKFDKIKKDKNDILSFLSSHKNEPLSNHIKNLNKESISHYSEILKGKNLENINRTPIHLEFTTFRLRHHDRHAG